MAIGTHAFCWLLAISLTAHAFKFEFHSSRNAHNKLQQANHFDEEHAKKYLTGYYEQQMSQYCQTSALAKFNSNTDLNNAEIELQATQASLAWANFESSEFAANISKFDTKSFVDQDLKRQFNFLKDIGTSALDQAKLEEHTKVLSEMKKIYGVAKVCPFEKQDCHVETEGFPLEPTLTELMAHPTPANQEALSYYWKGWRDNSGAKMRQKYLRYVQLGNEAAKLNGKEDMGAYWLRRYESETFRQDVQRVWQQVDAALYKPLFAYVRFKLIEAGFDIDDQGPIGAHILGNMWAQTWEYVMKYVVPYPQEPVFDITDKLQKLTEGKQTEEEKAKVFFEMANSFFTKTGLEDMKEAYSSKSMIVKPTDGREVICHASAWDFCDKNDFRIKMCTEINQADFFTIHHELGHIQYYKQYKNLPITYRTGANPGFHEAIGDVLALSVSSPKHLQAIGLITEPPTEKSMLNYLMQQALEKIAFLPFGYLIDSYRWKVFNGEIPPEKMTYEWIRMRGEIQGVAPPVTRNETDFDPGAKYHVPGNTPYIRYFVSFILQFQIQKKLCQVAGHRGPLYNCDIYQNQEAGRLFSDIMKAGASKPWQQLLEETIGTDKLDAAAIIEYFQPLTEYLRSHRASHGYDLRVNFNPTDYYNSN